MTAYYNEIDENAAAWLRELIREGHIADGIVDTRSIVAVEAADLRDFTQCHFFAGIGGWSYALRLAGWPDDKPVWTGSCPCQPFSAAGKRKGTADERHLWPEFHRLIGECRPSIVFGEQVASKDGLDWLDHVFADLEGSGYAVGAADLCAAGLGAPHIRQRLWFVGVADAESSGSGTGLRDSRPAGQRRHIAADGSGAHDMGDTLGARLEGHAGHGDGAGGRTLAARPVAEAGEPRGLADAQGGGRGEQRDAAQPGRGGHADGGGVAGRVAWQSYGDWFGVCWNACQSGDCRCGDRTDAPAGWQWDDCEGWVADADEGQCGRLADGEGRQRDGQEAGRQQGHGEPEPSGVDGRPGPVNGHWRVADWLYCRDGRWRPVEPGTFPLAHGLPARVGRLRGYGNAIVPQVAAQFIKAVM